MTRKHIAVFVLIFSIIIIAIVALLSKYPIETRVTALTWKRYINVQVYKSVTEDSLALFVPQNAYNVNHYTKTWTTYAQVSCGKKCTMSVPIFHSESRATYQVNKWLYDHTLLNEGDPHKERVYPDFTPDKDEFLGAQREIERGEQFYVHFADNHSDLTWAYMLTDYQEWIKYKVGDIYQFDSNRLNVIDWSNLKEVKK